MEESDFRLDTHAQGGKFSLSPLEQQILQMLANGKVVKEIARHHGRKPHWVHNICVVIKAKMHAHTTWEAIAIGIRSGIIL